MSTVVILSIGVAVAVVWPLALRIWQRRFDPFEPIVVFALAWGVMFVVRPIAIVLRDDTNFYGVDIGPTLDKAVLLGLVGAVAFVVGYEAPFGARLTRRVPRLPAADLQPGALALAAAVGVIAMIAFVGFLLWAGGPSAIGSFLDGRSPAFNDILQGSPLYLWWLSLAVVPAALVGLAVAYLHPRPAVVLGAAALFALALIRVVPTGGRGYLLMLVGSALVFIYLHHGRRPGLVAVVVGLAVALVGSYTVLLFRDSETRSDVVGQLASTPTHVLSPLVTGPDAEMAPALAGALLVVPSEWSHRYGAATFGDLVARPIPRQFWDDKPQPHTIRVTEVVWPIARETGDFQPAFTPLMSFYWDFGVLGAIVGLAAYGWLARLVYRYFLGDSGNASLQLLYALSFWTLVVALRADPVVLTFHCLIMFLPLLAIIGLASRLPDDVAAGYGQTADAARNPDGTAESSVLAVASRPKSFDRETRTNE
jgi:oligosaccharide repeat unit polymerase